ncbi:MAG: orotate phosphoribosyltransferase [Bdellovibrionaceae bacterium]|jgi:orotate phosphoribosyltransferase|nr:orotate phosphoribosyltransferase [Pseudobdellovibrionaceae bacterium]
MNRKELCKAVYDIAHLTGEFKLRSGLTSNEYFDKYRFEAQPKLLQEIAKQLKPLVPADVEVLAGLEMGGIPIATALSFETGLPVAFIRKEAKSYGTCQFSEGTEIKGKKVLVVEDVITTGGQVVESTNALRNEGALISQVLCVINRANGPSSKLQEINLAQLELFTMNELKDR